jgi:hypothetical protein
VTGILVRPPGALAFWGGEGPLRLHPETEGRTTVDPGVRLALEPLPGILSVALSRG